MRPATGEEEERAPFSTAPTMASTVASSSRLALAERALAEAKAERDEALRLLESARQENARLGAELERARSYKALYAAAHHVRAFFIFCGFAAGGRAGYRMCVHSQGPFFFFCIILFVFSKNFKWGAVVCNPCANT